MLEIREREQSSNWNGDEQIAQAANLPRTDTASHGPYNIPQETAQKCAVKGGKTFNERNFGPPVLLWDCVK